MYSGLKVFVDAVREVLDGCFVLYKGISCGWLNIAHPVLCSWMAGAWKFNKKAPPWKTSIPWRGFVRLSLFSWVSGGPLFEKKRRHTHGPERYRWAL